MGLYDNLTVFKPLGHELHTNMNTNALKPVLLTLSLFIFSIICRFNSSNLNTKKHKFVLNDVSYLFLLQSLHSRTFKTQITLKD
jgi:hypothetical protein